MLPFFTLTASIAMALSLSSHEYLFVVGVSTLNSDPLQSYSYPELAPWQTLPLTTPCFLQLSLVAIPQLVKCRLLSYILLPECRPEA